MIHFPSSQPTNVGSPAQSHTPHTRTHQHAVVEVSIAAEAVEAVARDVIGAELVPHCTDGGAPHGIVTVVELALLERQVEVAIRTSMTACWCVHNIVLTFTCITISEDELF